MLIQFNTDKTVSGDERNQAYFSTQIADELSKYESRITRIEVHLSDEDGKKSGVKDIRCLLEARVEGKPPIAVSSQENTIEQAVSKSLDKLKSSLESSLR